MSIASLDTFESEVEEPRSVPPKAILIQNESPFKSQNIGHPQRLNYTSHDDESTYYERHQDSSNNSLQNPVVRILGTPSQSIVESNTNKIQSSHRSSPLSTKKISTPVLKGREAQAIFVSNQNKPSSSTTTSSSSNEHSQKELLYAQTYLLQWRYLAAQLEHSMEKQRLHAHRLIKEETLKIALLHEEVMKLMATETYMNGCYNASSLLDCVDSCVNTLNTQHQFQPSYNGLMDDLKDAAGKLVVRNIAEHGDTGSVIEEAMKKCISPLEEMAVSIKNQHMLDPLCQLIPDLHNEIENTKEMKTKLSSMFTEVKQTLIKEASLRYQRQHQFQMNQDSISNKHYSF
eukprot:m.85315 g.85315  ORF g.85315 m.85315 type:complete len:345 (-) comp8739_c1_seq3:1060-2094(-)